MNDGASNHETESDAAHPCRACESPVRESAPTFPFCSERCRMVDLSNWFGGKYRISREIKDSDLETVD